MSRWSVGAGLTQASGTAIACLVPPMRGAITHVVNLAVLAGATAHTVWLLRPLNFTTLSLVAAAGQAVVNLTADPGLYTTGYQYPLGPTNFPGLAPPGLSGVASSATPVTFQVANLALAASQYLVFETPDGAFYFDTISSVATLAITMTSNLPTGGLAAGARVWQMGKNDGTSKDPATGLAPWKWLTPTAALDTLSAVAGLGGDLMQTLHPYDPLLLVDLNATNADTLNRFEGYYSRY